MIKHISLLLSLSLMVCSCSSKNKNMSPDKHDTELKPTVTSTTMNRSETGPLKQVESEVVESIVTVEKVNYDTRQMTVRNYQGMRESLTVAPEVKRLNEIKTGDRVALSFTRALAFEVREPTAAEIANPTMVGAAAKKNDLSLPPGVVAGSLMHTVVTVQQIDLASNTVVVKLPKGETHTILARYPENLKRIQVGDTVAVSYGEATAIEIKPLS